MRSVRDIPHLNDIPVLVRAALNVPIANGAVANSYRLKRALPTIDYLRAKNARVILIGHIGEAGTETLAPVCEAMKQFIPGIEFCPVSTGPQARAAARALPPGGVLMLENLRRDAGETANDPAFAAKLAELADVFVEDSFDVCHRAHASVVGVPKLLPSYAGLLVEEEVRELSKALKPAHPALAVIGGAKFSTKEPVLERLLETYDRVHVGGALGNDFIQARGYGVGKSLVSGADAARIGAMLKNQKLSLADDVIAAPPGSARAQGHAVAVDQIPADQAALDDGPQTQEALAALVAQAKTVLWNGPLGNYENGFIDATDALAQAIARSGAYSVIGGGDTVASIDKLGINDRFSFISTGGGAMLDFIAKGTLPGIAALS
jgi:phosphoglycerate kinase